MDWSNFASALLGGTVASAASIWYQHRYRGAPLRQSLYEKQLSSCAELQDLIFRHWDMDTPEFPLSQVDLINFLQRHSVLLPAQVIEVTIELAGHAPYYHEDGDLSTSDPILNKWEKVVRDALGVEGASGISLSELAMKKRK